MCIVEKLPKFASHIKIELLKYETKNVFANLEHFYKGNVS